MAHFKFEGDVTGISPRQIEYISSVLEELGYKNEKVLVEAVGKAGDNYVANVKRIIVDKDGDTFKMVAKVAPTLESIRTMMNTALMFRNEHVMYTEVLPKLEELQAAADIPKEERLRFAQCYGSLSEPPNEVILLEDLQLSNFVMLDRFVSLKDNSVKLVLKNFAILHSLSYALKKQEPDIYGAFKSKLHNLWEEVQNAEMMQAYFEQLENDIVNLVDSKHKKIFKSSISQLLVNSGKLVRIDKDSRYSVIQQGDSWTNNIMFRLEDDKAVDCCMIDYQVSKESSPVADIQYMIFNCTDHETRSKHYNDWIDYYHSELDKSLANFGLKANFIYPRDRLDADLKRYGKMSFGLCAMLASVLIKETADAAKLKAAMDNEDMDEMMNSSKVVNLDEKTVIRFKERLQGLADSFKEFGYL